MGISIAAVKCRTVQKIGPYQLGSDGTVNNVNSQTLSAWYGFSPVLVLDKHMYHKQIIITG